MLAIVVCDAVGGRNLGGSPFLRFDTTTDLAKICVQPLMRGIFRDVESSLGILFTARHSFWRDWFASVAVAFLSTPGCHRGHAKARYAVGSVERDLLPAALCPL